jgi:hypothetical protein
MECLEGSGVPVLYIGRTVPEGLYSVCSSHFPIHATISLCLYDHTNNKVLGNKQHLCISIYRPLTSSFTLFSLPYPTKQPHYTSFTSSTTFHTPTKTIGLLVNPT